MSSRAMTNTKNDKKIIYYEVDYVTVGSGAPYISSDQLSNLSTCPNESVKTLAARHYKHVIDSTSTCAGKWYFSKLDKVKKRFTVYSD